MEKWKDFATSTTNWTHNTTSLSKSWQFQQKMIVCELVRCVFCLFNNYPVEIAFLFSTKWMYNCTLVDNLFVFFFLSEEPSHKKTALSWLVDGLVGWLVWITNDPCVYAEEFRCLKMFTEFSYVNCCFEFSFEISNKFCLISDSMHSNWVQFGWFSLLLLIFFYRFVAFSVVSTGTQEQYKIEELWFGLVRSQMQN